MASIPLFLHILSIFLPSLSVFSHFCLVSVIYLPIFLSFLPVFESSIGNFFRKSFPWPARVDTEQETLLMQTKLYHVVGYSSGVSQVLAPDCSSVTPPPPTDLWSCHTPPASQYIMLALLVDIEFMDIHICLKCI